MTINQNSHASSSSLSIYVQNVRSLGKGSKQKKYRAREHVRSSSDPPPPRQLGMPYLIIR